MKRRRTIKACARCYARKVKCDGIQPCCSNCLKSGHRCEALNSTTGSVQPRSIFLHLQQQVAVKERQLRLSSSDRVQTASTHHVPPTRSRRDETRSHGSSRTTPSQPYQWVDQGFYASFCGRATSQNVLPADFLMMPPIRHCHHCDASKPANAENLPVGGFQIDDPRSVEPYQDLRAMPLDVARRLFREYIKVTLPVWPAFLPDELQELFSHVFEDPRDQNGPRDPFAIFIISMVLAICIVSNKAYSPEKAFPSSLKLYRLALQTEHDFTVPSDTNIKRLILLIQFCYVVPSAGHVGPLSSLMMRMALDLKLHLGKVGQAQSEHPLGRSSTTASRKLLFWCAYAIERSVSFTLHRRLVISDECIGVETINEEDIRMSLEDSDGYEGGDNNQNVENEATAGESEAQKIIPANGGRVAVEFLRIISLRKIETNIFQVRFMGCRRPSGVSNDEWVSEMEQRAFQWLLQVGSTQGEGSQEDITIDTYDCSKYEPGWALVGYFQALLLLYRPCPTEPDPDRTTLVKSFHAARKLADTTFDYMGKGRLRLPWHGANQSLQAGLVLLYALKYAYVPLIEEKGLADILQSVSIFSTLFQLLSQSWSEAIKFGALYEKLQRDVVDGVLRPWDKTRSTSATGKLLENLVQPQRVGSKASSANPLTDLESQRHSVPRDMLGHREGETDIQSRRINTYIRGSDMPVEYVVPNGEGTRSIPMPFDPNMQGLSRSDTGTVDESAGSTHLNQFHQAELEHSQPPFYPHHHNSSALPPIADVFNQVDQADDGYIPRSRTTANLVDRFYHPPMSLSHHPNLAILDTRESGASLLSRQEQSLGGPAARRISDGDHLSDPGNGWMGAAPDMLIEAADVNSLSGSYISAQGQMNDANMVGATVGSSTSHNTWEWTTEMLDAMFDDTSNFLEGNFDMNSGMWFL